MVHGRSARRLAAKVQTFGRHVLAAADFFTVEVWTGRRLTRFAVLFLIELSTRRIEIAGITSEPDAPG